MVNVTLYAISQPTEGAATKPDAHPPVQVSGPPPNTVQVPLTHAALQCFEGEGVDWIVCEVGAKEDDVNDGVGVPDKETESEGVSL
jgi:hypothetical protein